MTQDTTSESELPEAFLNASVDFDPLRDPDWQPTRDDYAALRDTIRTHYEQMKKERDEAQRDWEFDTHALQDELSILRSQLTEQRAVIEVAARIFDSEIDAAPEWLAELRHHARRALSALSQEETP